MQRNAFVLEVQPQQTLVFDQAIQGFDDYISLASFAATVSNGLSATVISALNHDDDLLGLSLIQNGIEIDFYLSNPDFVDAESGPNGDAAAWCGAFDVPWLETSLKELFASDGFTIESERHTEIARMFGWPDAVVGYSFDQLDAGERPDGFDEKLIHRLSPEG
jgi:hypothetical protein